jgi:Fur family ferric uptake transcriptional regulator
MADSMAKRLQEAGYRLTAPRQAVLQVVEAEKGHLSPAEVLRRGQIIHPELSRATVYRTLEILTELGMLRPLYLGERGSQVACVTGGHHHLLCLECGRTIHFDDCLIQQVEEMIATRLGFQIKSHLLEFYGICGDCSQHLPHRTRAVPPRQAVRLAQGEAEAVGLNEDGVPMTT